MRSHVQPPTYLCKLTSILGSDSSIPGFDSIFIVSKPVLVDFSFRQQLDRGVVVGESCQTEQMKSD